MLDNLKAKFDKEKVKKNAKNVGLFVGGYVSAVVLRGLLGRSEDEGEFVEDGDYEDYEEEFEADENLED